MSADRKTHCSVHDHCIWELTLDSAKANADDAIRRMWRAEERAAQAEAENARLKAYVTLIRKNYSSLPCDIDMKLADEALAPAAHPERENPAPDAPHSRENSPSGKAAPKREGGKP